MVGRGFLNNDYTSIFCGLFNNVFQYSAIASPQQGIFSPTRSMYEDSPKNDNVTRPGGCYFYVIAYVLKGHPKNRNLTTSIKHLIMLIISTLFPQEWIKANPNYLASILPSKETVPETTIKLQLLAFTKWGNTPFEWKLRSAWNIIYVHFDHTWHRRYGYTSWQFFNYCRKNPKILACSDKRRWTWSNVSISGTI
jgi:hypothetical protein